MTKSAMEIVRERLGACGDETTAEAATRWVLRAQSTAHAQEERDAIAASLATLREAVLRFDATEDVGDDIEKAGDALTAALAATASPTEHGERVIAGARASAVRRIAAAVHCASLDEDGLVEHLDRVAKSHDRSIAEAEERGAWVMKAAARKVVEIRQKGESKGGNRDGIETCRLVLVFLDELDPAEVLAAARKEGTR